MSEEDLEKRIIEILKERKEWINSQPKEYWQGIDAYSAVLSELSIIKQDIIDALES